MDEWKSNYRIRILLLRDRVIECNRLLILGKEDI